MSQLTITELLNHAEASKQTTELAANHHPRIISGTSPETEKLKRYYRNV
jgi:hypothetical protein